MQLLGSGDKKQDTDPTWHSGEQYPQCNVLSVRARTFRKGGICQGTVQKGVESWREEQ